MLRAQIYEELKAAMKAQEKEKLETIRFVWSEIKRVEIDAKHELGDEEVVVLLRKEVKRRKEAVEQMRAGGRSDGVAREEAQLEIINRYLPALLTEEQINQVVEKIVAGGEREFGAVMKTAMSQLKGKADGALVSQVVKAKLG